MSTFPASARAVVIGCGIVGNSLAYHLTRLGWTDVVQIDKGPLPNPGGSTGHASNFIFPVDHSKEMTQLTLESQRQYVEMGVNTECGGIEVARTEERMEELRRRMASAKSWGVDSARLVTPGRDQGARAVHRRDDPARRLLLPDRLRRRLPARGHDHARAGDRLRRPAGVREHRRQRHGRRGRPDQARAHLARADRGGDGRDRLRRLEPAAREDGRRAHPAHARRAPDDRRRPGAALRGVVERDRVPDRARHGRVHVRAPGRRRPRDRLVRAPLDPPRPGGDPVDRGGGALADRVPVHAGRLRRPDGARARADAGDRRRRVRRREVRDQRADLADARRDADPRRDSRGEGPLVGGRGVGEGGAGRRQVARRVDGARRVAHRPPHLRREPLPRPPEDARAREGAHLRGVPEDLRDRPPGRAVGERARAAQLARCTRRRRRSAPRSTRRSAGSGRSGTRRTRRSSSATASSRAAPSGMRAGGRRSSTPSTSRCASTPASSTSPHSRSSTSAARVRSTRCSTRSWRRWTCPSAASSTRRCSARAAASSPTSRSCGSASRSSASSPAARTAWPTASCSPTRCPPTARRRSST